ncbi:hypothetical protein VNO77_14585 [Canavalia gladiata]|uniref:Uncharacterized protein n=1 Tax=Canavalia gladiata TaxID=3824 RepID=A0AAN9QS17_CANGL
MAQRLRIVLGSRHNDKAEGSADKLKYMAIDSKGKSIGTLDEIIYMVSLSLSRSSERTSETEDMLGEANTSRSHAQGKNMGLCYQRRRSRQNRPLKTEIWVGFRVHLGQKDVCEQHPFPLSSPQRLRP